MFHEFGNVGDCASASTPYVCLISRTKALPPKGGLRTARDANHVHPRRQCCRAAAVQPNEPGSRSRHHQRQRWQVFTGHDHPAVPDRSSRPARGGSRPTDQVEWPRTVNVSGLSCSYCIQTFRADLRRAAGFLPDFYRTYAELEQHISHTLSPTRRPRPEVKGLPLTAAGSFEDLAGPIGS